MRIKMGTFVQKMGTNVPMAVDQTRYRKAVATALRTELGPTHQGVMSATLRDRHSGKTNVLSILA